MSTPPYASKVPPPQGDPIDVFVSGQSRLLQTPVEPRYSRLVPPPPPHDDDGNENDAVGGTITTRRTYTDCSYMKARLVGPDGRMSHVEGELDYSRHTEMTLCDGAVPRSRDSSPSQMNSPPLGDSPPQGNLDGTVLVVSSC